MTQALAKGSRITGDQRAALASEYAQRYAAGESIRQIAEDAGRSFGFVHGVLRESGVALRGRGGATRGVPSGPGKKPSSGGKEAVVPGKRTGAKAPTAKKAVTTKTAKAPTAKKAGTTKTAG